jgi:acyl-CoA synthetase (NDP forming)/RimJ/RimL family protein N-acetyltransferase
VADVVLRDGRTVRIRPISPDDGPALVRFHERQSAESIYFRFFSPRPRLTDQDVHHFTHVDHRDRVAFVAELGGELIGVARYERYAGTDTAEVAFFVDDAHHGRGLGTVMLEFLAAAGRERGVRRFTASTLPNNRKMLAVFASAGFEVASHLADGVVEVAFDIHPTDEVVAAMDRRERLAEAASVRRLLQPRSVAVVVDEEARATGAMVLANLVHHRFTGVLHPVGPVGPVPSGASVLPVASVADLPDGVDLVVAAVGPGELPALVEVCAGKGTGGVVVVSGGAGALPGSAESLRRRLVDAARAGGLRLLGPACLGLVNTDPGVRLHATVSPATPPAGPIGMLAESGALAGSILEHAERTGLGLSTFVAAGSPSDVTAADLLSYWTEDGGTAGVLLYLAARRLPSRFVRAARAASLAKPVAVLHTSVGPRSGPRRRTLPPSRDEDRLIEAMFRQTGVISVGTLEQLFDLGRVLADQPSPAGRGVAVVGTSEGAVTLAADACTGAGLEVVRVGGTTRAGRAWSNPADLGFSPSPEDLAEVLDGVAAHPEVASVVVVHAPLVPSPDDEVPRAVLEASRRHPAVTFTATVLGAGAATRLVLDEDGTAVPMFSFPEHAARALGRLAAYREWRASAEVHGEGRAAGFDAAAARGVVLRALERRRPGEATVVLDHHEQEEVLGAFSVAVAERRTVTSVDDAVEAARAIGWPVALKARVRDRRRRSALGGVAIDLADEADLRGTWDRMVEALGEGMFPAVVQRFVERGVDVAVRLRRFPNGAGTVEVGLGGPAAFLDGWELAVLPLTLADASSLVSASSVGQAVTDPLDRVGVVGVVHRLAALVEEVEEVHELVADPVVCSGAGAWVADVAITVGDPVDEFAVRRLD